MHLADAFIQSDLQCIQAIHFISMCVPWDLRTDDLSSRRKACYPSILLNIRKCDNSKLFFYFYFLYECICVLCSVEDSVRL